MWWQCSSIRFLKRRRACVAFVSLHKIFAAVPTNVSDAVDSPENFLERGQDLIELCVRGVLQVRVNERRPSMIAVGSQAEQKPMLVVNSAARLQIGLLIPRIHDVEALRA